MYVFRFQLDLLSHGYGARLVVAREHGQLHTRRVARHLPPAPSALASTQGLDGIGRLQIKRITKPKQRRAFALNREHREHFALLRDDLGGAFRSASVTQLERKLGATESRTLAVDRAFHTTPRDDFVIRHGTDVWQNDPPRRLRHRGGNRVGRTAFEAQRVRQSLD